MRKRQKIEEWGSDTKFQGETLEMYHTAGDTAMLEAFFPEREDLYHAGEMIDAALVVFDDPEWPDLSEDLTRAEATRVIYAIAIADALHEVIESITVAGRRPLRPHPGNGPQDEPWALLTSIADEAAQRLLAEYPR